MLLSLFFSERKTGGKTTWQNQGEKTLKDRFYGDTPSKKKGWGFKERQNLIETCLKKNDVFVAECHLQENILKDTLLGRWGTDQLSLGCMNFTPIPAAICEKNGPTLSIFKSHKTKQKITSHGVSHQHP